MVMNKILMILLVVLCLSSCTEDYVAIEDTQGVVEKVELAQQPRKPAKYKVFVKCPVRIWTPEKEMLRSGFYLYTNKLYTVGDTIYIR